MFAAALLSQMSAAQLGLTLNALEMGSKGNLELKILFNFGFKFTNRSIMVTNL